jgi:hypothetical protein
MIVKIAQALATAERRDTRRFDYPPQVFANKNYRQFMAELYYPIGGMRAVIGAVKRAPKTVQEQHSSEKAIRFLVKLAGVLHYHAQQLRHGGGSFKDLTLTHDAAIVPKLKLAMPLSTDGERVEEFRKNQRSEPRSTGTMWNYLRSHEPTVHFLYAASGIELEGTGTLLDVILSGTAKYSVVKELIPRWFSAAQYAADNVFAKLQAKTGGTVRLLPATKFADPVPFEPPDYDLEDQQKIDEHIKMEE